MIYFWFFPLILMFPALYLILKKGYGSPGVIKISYALIIICMIYGIYLTAFLPYKK